MHPSNSIVQAAELRRQDLLAVAARERLLDQVKTAETTPIAVAPLRLNLLHSLKAILLATAADPRTAAA